MDWRRVLTSVLGIPIVILIVIFGNRYVLNILFTLIGLLCMHEYIGVIEKVSHPMKWVAYLSTLTISLVGFVTEEILMKSIIFIIPIILLILFLKVIITNMETTVKDVSYTFLGIGYITLFIMFLNLISCMDNGKIYLGYTLAVAWSTDVFAYLIGIKYGKHKFSKVSPKKSIEGCIAGIIGAIIFTIIYVLVIKRFTYINYPYWAIVVVTFILSIISQIGDFVASSIKRFADVKDYGNLLPGHGGMLDRIDSLIFIAPFLYIILTFATNLF